jgi:hypothetical protein
MSGKAPRVGTVSVVPLTDMRKLLVRALHVAPPSGDVSDENVTPDTSEVGVVVLSFQTRKFPVLPLNTTKYCELGASEIGELGEYVPV